MPAHPEPIPSWARGERSFDDGTILRETKSNGVSGPTPPFGAHAVARPRGDSPREPPAGDARSVSCWAHPRRPLGLSGLLSSLATHHRSLVSPRKYFLPLDGVRGLAVLAVMILHFTMFDAGSGAEHFFAGWLQTGWIGVDLFFVLSGFLITGILVDTRDDPHHFRNFYARRTLRIFPLYYAYLVLLFVLLPTLHAGYALEHATDDRRIWLWTYLGNILMARGWEAMPAHTTHLWSLAVEEQFYLVWPLLVYLARRRWLTALCGVTFLGAVLTRAYLTTVEAAAAAYVLTPARMDTLAAGALVAVVMKERGLDGVRSLVRPLFWSGFFLVAAGTLWSFTHGTLQVLAPLDYGTETFAYPGVALVFAALIAHVVSAAPTATLPRFLSKPSLRTLGAYSYGLYLIHVPVRNALRLGFDARGGLPEVGGSQVPAQLLVTTVGIGISFALAYASWHLFEKRVLALKRHFAYRSTGTGGPVLDEPRTIPAPDACAKPSPLRPTS